MLFGELAMPAQPMNREFAFTIMDVARMIKTYADQRARQFGISRAQWAVLVRIDRSEGLKQSELAEILDLQPISLTRLLDRLADNKLIVRRAYTNFRRANRLFLTPAARPLLEQLADLGEDMMATVLDGLDAKTIERTLRDLERVRENLRAAINRHPSPQEAAAS
jgi:MarR family transcriptional regulator for hemolysin